ncbi:glutamate--cysteine ligase [Actinocorallia sp. API 0066]|uniref:carboxylate-amine ligase n=1 Tax=Actinocorallia sp. API 0066 TaxID=2896846 RepID=UPI001E430608|nr:glutamate--cysteine ligase [Actinocorallia sp. API 0066]MCD0449159.1 glutamate--cysteine ligase [Actinocorallia sp. API 0066]
MGQTARVSEPGTVGVEEELLLVEPDTGEPSGRAHGVMARAAVADGFAGEFHAEMQETQVEAVTRVHTRLADLRVDVAAGRRVLAEAARQEGLALVSSGTPVVATRDPPPTDGERFARVRDLYAGVARGYQVCGCHVHVGVPDRETAVAVVNHLRPWLPVLLALSVNSPYHHARDSGYASWRMVEQAPFPGGGVPPYFRSAREHDEAVARLVDCGVLVDPAMTFWTARPSPRYPTVEVRAADAAGTVGEAVLQAALTRALVATARAELAVGREAAPLDAQVCAAAQWAAARYGLCGALIDPVSAAPVAAFTRVAALFAAVRNALEDAGDLDAARALWRALRDDGTGAQRQLLAGEGGPRAVLDLLAAQTDPEEEP